MCPKHDLPTGSLGISPCCTQVGIAPRLSGARLNRFLRLPSGVPTFLTRRVTFAAAHRYRRPDWDEATNQRTFGACAHPHFHGHSYRCDVTVRGEVDPVTGFVVDLGELDAVLASEVRARFDHRNLNLDVPEFADGALAARGSRAQVVRVTVAEDETLSATYEAD